MAKLFNPTWAVNSLTDMHENIGICLKNYKTLETQYHADMQSFEHDMQEKFLEQVNKIQSLNNYLVEREKNTENFLQTLMDNITIIQGYTNIQLLDSKMNSEIALEQQKALALAPWYKKLFKSQRAKILAEVERKIKESYDLILKDYKNKLNKAIQKVLEKDQKFEKEDKE